jgi:hypothetical protein
MAYNLRTTSLFGSHLDSALSEYGARTSGNTRRKQARLQRFVDAKNNGSTARQNLAVVIQNEQRKVYQRGQTRASEILAAHGLLSMGNPARRTRQNTHLFFD